MLAAKKSSFLSLLSAVFISGAASSAATEPPLSRLPQLSRATTANLPPSRPCPKNASDCMDISATMTYPAFLRWAGQDVSRIWANAFTQSGLRWHSAREVEIGSGSSLVSSCEPKVRVVAGSGPFYCSSDSYGGTVYLPLTGIEQLLFPSGDYRGVDFALSYVVAHEWGHHVQDMLGLLDSRPSILIELQADCLAGVWGYTAWARGLLSPGDITKAVLAANLAGDTPGTPATAPGAHGSGAQRVAAFLAGYKTGRATSCNRW